MDNDNDNIILGPEDVDATSTPSSFPRFGRFFQFVNEAIRQRCAASFGLRFFCFRSSFCGAQHAKKK